MAARELEGPTAAQIFAQMIRAGRQIIVPLYAANELSLSVAEIGSIVSISSAVDMSLFLPAGFLMDKLGVSNTVHLTAAHIKPVKVDKPMPEALQAAAK